MAWQLATLASLVVSYIASYHFSGPLTDTGLFGDSAPWNRFAAMLVVYLVVGLVIWMGFRVVAEAIDRVKLRDFDRQLGGVFGFVKGILFCVLITFFVVTLLPTFRDKVIGTFSGRGIAKLLAKADTLMPPEFHTLLEPYLKRFEENLQPNYLGADPASRWPTNVAPTPENVGDAWARGLLPGSPQFTGPQRSGYAPSGTQPPTVDGRIPQPYSNGDPNGVWSGRGAAQNPAPSAVPQSDPRSAPPGPQPPPAGYDPRYQPYPSGYPQGGLPPGYDPRFGPPAGGSRFGPQIGPPQSPVEDLRRWVAVPGEAPR
ncbi:MAG: CvpA family protein [Pirellulales bacterium]